MANKLTGSVAEVGDVLLAAGKLIKYSSFRVGSGGLTLGSTETVVTSAQGFFQVPSQGLVVDAFANILTAATGTTKTFNVGLYASSSGGVNNGFLASISGASTGVVRASVTTATSGAGTGGLIFVANTYGSFLSGFTSGSTATAGDSGLFYRKNFATTSVTAKTFSVTPDSTEFDSFKADVYVGFIDLTR